MLRGYYVTQETKRRVLIDANFVPELYTIELTPDLTKFTFAGEERIDGELLQAAQQWSRSARATPAAPQASPLATLHPKRAPLS